jgi:MOSC domain-containing protein YiiM
MMSGTVVAVSRSPTHSLSKQNVDHIQLHSGFGVEGDVHAGPRVKHRSRVAQDPGQPNLRQVHLMHAELFAELAAAGFSVGPGTMGENITTAGLDLLALPTGTRLLLGSAAVVQLTGLRNPCSQLDTIRTGLMAATLARDPSGRSIPKAGVMAVVVAGGLVRAGDSIRIQRPGGSPQPLRPV